MHLRKFFRQWSRNRLYNAAVSGRRAGLAQIAQHLSVAYRPVTSPLVLISQAERSGGSLLAQLFDGHSRILAHPPELHIGYPNKQNWPPTGIEDVDLQFRTLFEARIVERCESGYGKGKYADARNFFLVPQVQREIFRAMMETGARSSRHVLDAYFTSYFNAWLNLRTRIDDAAFITAFAPMLAADEQNMAQFWETYPDGYLISIIRSPLNWYPSFVTLKSDQRVAQNLETSLGRWRAMAEGLFREKKRRPDRVLVIGFDDLLGQPEATMRAICARMNIDFEDVLKTPTFNRDPVEANTVFEPLKPGEVSSTPSRRETLISEETREYIDRTCMPLYDRVIHELAEVVFRGH
jgi:hypothetical protein